MVIEIPKQLQDEKIRMIIVNTETKRPIEIAWTLLEEDYERQLNGTWKNKKTGELYQTKKGIYSGPIHNYKYNDKKIQDRLDADESYGIIGNYILPIDTDTKEASDYIEKHFSETLTIQSGSHEEGKFHYFFIPEKVVDRKIPLTKLKGDKKGNVIKDKDGKPIESQYADIQGKGAMVVGPGCRHQSGNRYDIVKDVPIAVLSEKQLNDFIKEFSDSSIATTEDIEKWKGKRNFDATNIEEQLNVASVFSIEGFKRSGDEYYGAHPIHGSTNKTPMNCFVNPSKNIWKCFRTGHGGGGVASAIAVNEGIIQCSQAKGKLSKENYLKVLEIAESKYGFNSSKDIKDLQLNTFIFDDDEVLKFKAFPIHLINDNILAYGIKLPRNEDIINKKTGNIIGKEQIWRPVVILSNNTGEVVTERFKEKYKITFESIPTENNLNWSLASIKNYIDGKAKKINGKDLFNKIKKQYQKFCYFRDSEWYDVHPLWDMGTYIFLLFSHFPIFEMNGMKNTAKTKVMVISSFVTFNSTGVMINPTEASLFRITEEQRPTKYIDEAENLYPYNSKGQQDESDPRIQLINESYHRGGKVPRIEKIGNKFFNKWYNVYSPTMIGSIRGLTGATETRAITNIMVKNPKSDSRGELNVEDFENDPIWKEIRDELRVFILQNWKKIIEKKDEVDSDKIKGRNKQLWLPLLSIAKSIDEKLYERVKKFAEEVSEQKVRDNISEGTLDFYIIQSVFQKLITKGNESLISNRVYVQDITDMVKLKSDWTYIAPKTISNHLDRLGFKRFRKRDTNRGSYFELIFQTFKEIINPICEQLFEEEEKMIINRNMNNTINMNNMGTSDRNNKKNITKNEKNKQLLNG